MSHLPHRRAVLAGLAALPVATAFPAAAEAVQRPYSLRIVMSGHSLTDPIFHPLEVLVRAAGGAEATGMTIDKSTVPGSPAELRWDAGSIDPVDARREIANYDLLVLTERVPVRVTRIYHNSDSIALTWFEHAWKNGKAGKGAETVLYASWISIDSGKPSDWDKTDDQKLPFRERLDVEMKDWQAIADFVNANRPAGSPAMRVIPGPLIMAAIFDAVQAGTAPDLPDMRELFIDDIHVGPKGAFPIAVGHFAVIYGRDPRALPTIREDGWPSPAQQEWMKALVWDVCRAYTDSGLA